MSVKKEQPTVVPSPRFSPFQDAQDLRKAMKGFGTDNQAIIDILTKRSNAQRQEIMFTFKKEFGRDLISDLKSELSGNFERLILGLMETPVNYLASELRYAMEGLGTNEDALTEIIVTQPNHRLMEISNAYKAKYGVTLEADVSSEVSGYYKRLLIALLTCSRDENGIHLDKVSNMAQRLYEAGEKRRGTDEDTFISILANVSPQQIRLVSEEYAKVYKRTLAEAITSEFSGDTRKTLLAILKCAESPVRFWAEQLEESMKGLGTNDSKLIRIIVSRSEIDLGTIKHVYMSMYRRTLFSAVNSETSGYYRKALLALINNE